MQLIIQLPTHEEQLALNRRRWSEILSDSSLAELPYRIETNELSSKVCEPVPVLFCLHSSGRFFR